MGKDIIKGQQIKNSKSMKQKFEMKKQATKKI